MSGPVLVQFPNSNVDRERYDKRYNNRAAPCNCHLSLAGAAGLQKYVYGNGFIVMESYIGNSPFLTIFLSLESSELDWTQIK